MILRNIYKTDYSFSLAGLSCTIKFCDFYHKNRSFERIGRIRVEGFFEKNKKQKAEYVT